MMKFYPYPGHEERYVAVCDNPREQVPSVVMDNADGVVRATLTGMGNTIGVRLKDRWAGLTQEVTNRLARQFYSNDDREVLMAQDQPWMHEGYERKFADSPTEEQLLNIDAVKTIGPMPPAQRIEMELALAEASIGRAVKELLEVAREQERARVVKYLRDMAGVSVIIGDMKAPVRREALLEAAGRIEKQGSRRR